MEIFSVRDFNIYLMHYKTNITDNTSVSLYYKHASLYFIMVQLTKLYLVPVISNHMNAINTHNALTLSLSLSHIHTHTHLHMNKLVQTLSQTNTDTSIHTNIQTNTYKCRAFIPVWDQNRIDIFVGCALDEPFDPPKPSPTENDVLLSVEALSVLHP